MFIDSTDIEKRRNYLMEAFCDEGFQKALLEECQRLEFIVKEFANKIEPINKRIGNVFSVESRVKSSRSFEEKLFRKDYIHRWNVTDDLSENRNLICSTLTDIIGIRVNCYFENFEKIIYDAFEREFHPEGYDLDFNEKKEQQNGHVIYKFSGLSDNQFHFEVQIKSVIHNVWGETEHKNVYKNLSYDGYVEEKKNITESLYKVLRASEKQLYDLFTMEEPEEQLLKSLFFCYTKDAVSTQCKTAVLAEHYSRFFKVFTDISEIKAYIVDKLSGRDYEKKYVGLDYSHLSNSLIDKFKQQFPPFYIKCICAIDSILHKYDSSEDQIGCLISQMLPKQEDDDFDSGYADEFMSDQDDIDEGRTDADEDGLNKINDILGGCRIKA